MAANLVGDSFRYPLRSWTLRGFRAIRDETTFPLGGLNVLVGANSAGKSSVLHSLLLTAQTLATPLADRPLVLNGSLVRLGLADDCVHEHTDNEVTIAFSLNPGRLEFGRPVLRETTALSVKAQFVVAEDDTNFELANSRVVTTLEDSNKVVLEVKSRSDADAHRLLLEKGADDNLADESVGQIGQGVSGDVPDKTVGVYTRQFLPNSLAVLVNAYQQEFEELGRMWRPRIGRVGAGRKAIPISEPISNLIRKFLTEIHGDDMAAQLPPDRELPIQALGKLPPSVGEEIRGLRHPWFAQHVKSDLPFKGVVENQSMVNVLDASVDAVRWWFSRSVRHLGPLRASPQPLYGLPEAASGASVGQNGEYTAAVLSTYGKRVAVRPMPNGREESVRLSTAVDRWVEALGLLAAVHPKEMGKLGYELGVSIEGLDRHLDLTTVGVGVSQALPIIVLGLIAEPGSLLLFEQPELHLHPDVQAALGDFFLALSRSGRQLLIETHSEYLITRLRRRQAVEEGSDAADLTRLFFFERDGPAAKVTPARIGPDGSMPDWPRGFLDTAAREYEAMVMEADE